MADRRYQNKRRRETGPGPEQVILEGIFKGLFALVAWLYRLITKAPAKKVGSIPDADRARIEEAWHQVEFHATQDGHGGIAVSEADKAFDTALKSLGFPGQTMADRLRAAESRFPADLYQDIWRAHKLRNALAHELGASASKQEAQQAVAVFRRALYQLEVF